MVVVSGRKKGRKGGRQGNLGFSIAGYSLFWVCFKLLLGKKALPSF
jgi:hypothetical protein